MPNQMDWNALAPFWHLFETHGLYHTLITALTATLRGPLLFVGGGRGTLPKQLMATFGADGVLVLDKALAMAQVARTSFGLSYVCADVLAIPFAGGRFASALCATGVFEYLDDAQRLVALRELARMVRDDDSPIVVTAFAERDDQPIPRIADHLERWYRHNETLSLDEKQSMRAYNGVARALGDRDAAYALLKRSLPDAARAVHIPRFNTPFMQPA